MGLFITLQTHPINLQQIQQATRSPQKNLIRGHNRGKIWRIIEREREGEMDTNRERDFLMCPNGLWGLRISEWMIAGSFSLGVGAQNTKTFGAKVSKPKLFEFVCGVYIYSLQYVLCSTRHNKIGKMTIYLGTFGDWHHLLRLDGRRKREEVE